MAVLAPKKRVPASIRAVSSEVIQCPEDAPYGFQLSITYQVYADDGQPLQQAGLVPLESISMNGTNVTDGYVQLGAPTNAQGQFTDGPYGTCSSSPFTDSGSQIIAFNFEGTRYYVRNNNFTFTSKARGQGTVSNGTDVKKTIP